MSDFALQVIDGQFDLVFDGDDLVLDDSLMPALLVSLGTNRLADPSDAIPDGTDDRRGWWADIYDMDQIGSRLWLLERSKDLPATRQALRDYDIEALTWLVKDGIWSSFDAAVTVPARGVLQHVITPVFANHQNDDVITLTTPRVAL